MQKMRYLTLTVVFALAILIASYQGWLYAATPGQSATPTASASPTNLLPTPTLAAFAAANPLEDQVVETYEASRASVVNVTNRRYAVNNFSQPVPEQGTGSGFFYDSSGHIVTNFHVVEDASELLVTLADGRNFTATLVGEDPSTDLAVIRIAGEELPPPLPREQEPQRVGNFVIAIGNPFGLEGTLTVGVISALGRVIESPDNRFIGEAIQTDAAINPGNSGGPLLDLGGKVIGVNSQIISASGSNSGIGFAVPARTLDRVVSQLIDVGYYAHPYLGIEPLDIGPAQAQALRDAGVDLPVEQGLLVVNVLEGGPADEAGLRGGDTPTQLGNIELNLGGDIITAIDDTPVRSLQDLTVYLESETTVGATVTLSLIRDGTTQTVDVVLAERPQPDQQ